MHSGLTVDLLTGGLVDSLAGSTKHQGHADLSPEGTARQPMAIRNSKSGAEIAAKRHERVAR